MTDLPSGPPILVRSVGIGVRGVAGDGELSVYPGDLVVTPGKTTARLSGVTRVEADAEQVILILCARLMFPWMNMSVFISGRSGGEPIDITAHGSCIGRKTLVEALRTAGFAVTEKRAWIRIGWLESNWRTNH